jgi:predicted nucleic acid-binding protein
MIHLDTCVLIDVLGGHRALAPRLRQLLERGERISFSSLVLFEWRRGPRMIEQIEAQESLFPSSEAVAFEAADAIRASEIYRRLKRPRGREVDIAIAACAITHDAKLWTLNTPDFEDIPDVQLMRFP